jgi:sterol desaturase/sphingolipid hydroxylase (fatty acid hydroxylase superfamily)
MQVPPLPQVALTILAIDFLRYALAAGAVWLLVHVWLRRRLAGRRILDALPAPGQIRREVVYSLSTIAIFATNGLMVWLLIGNGTLKVYPDVARHGWAWWWASLALMVVAHDAWFYWTHRALHHRRWFRAVHGRHHASRHPTPWAAYAFHPVEALVQAMFMPLFLLVVPVHTGVMAVFLLHMILRNVIGHCAHELFPWNWTPHGWLGWITPVSHHHFHHARNRGNYGLYFTWWDRLCGTEDAEYIRHGDRRFGATSPSAQPSATA